VPGGAGHLFLAQRSGSVLELDETGKQVGVVLSITREVSKGAEQGLLSIAFDPAYPRNHRLYVDYTGLDGSIQVDAYTVEGGVAVRPQRLLTIAHPARNHNGGQLLFDRTGMLLVGIGDGGNAGDPDNRAQDLRAMLGKILRIDPRTGRPAAGNPYPENRYVWALGLRNPWRFSFDAGGTLYLGDIGQNRVEELDVVPPSLQRGANYGWSVFEGDDRFKPDSQLAPGGPLIVPALTYSHADGGCAITAGEVYRGRLLPWLRGRFVYGDYCFGHVMAVTRTPTGVGEPLDLGVKAEALQSFGHDAHGELLVLSFDGLYRLVPGA
jgi:glucose/arabinose dehydrogenase